MSALNGKQWVAGHIGTTGFESKPVEVEPMFFVTIDRNDQTVTINDEVTNASAIELQAFITTAATFAAETIPGSGVYRLTLEQLRAMGVAAKAAKAAFRQSLAGGAVTRQDDRSRERPATSGCFVPGCHTAVCDECDPQSCTELAQVEAQQVADWRDDFESQSRPGAW